MPSTAQTWCISGHLHIYTRLAFHAMGCLLVSHGDVEAGSSQSP